MNICVPEGTTLYLIETLDLECNIRNYIYNDLNYANKESEKAFFSDEKILSIKITDLSTDKVINIYQRTKLLEKFISKNMENLKNE